MNPNPSLLKLSYICCVLSFFYWIFVKSPVKLYPLTHFPELYEGGPTCVHLLDPDSKSPIKPAYFILDERGEPTFIDLYTNQTIGNTYQYTGSWFVTRAYKKIRLTDIIYNHKRIYDYVRNKHNGIDASNPLWQRIWAERRIDWWPRLVSQYEQLLEYD
jgi:hypothetical protein